MAMEMNDWRIDFLGRTLFAKVIFAQQYEIIMIAIGSIDLMWSTNYVYIAIVWVMQSFVLNAQIFSH